MATGVLRTVLDFQVVPINSPLITKIAVRLSQQQQRQCVHDYPHGPGAYKLGPVM